jgi:hypothetical protein
MQRFLIKVVVPVLIALLTSTLTATVKAQAAGERGKNRGGEGPTHLVLTYSCAPQKRVAFRDFMETKGVNQFEKWKKDGVVKNYLILFSTFVNEQLFDMWVILDFDKFADVANWQKVEHDFPGGLSAEGLALASPRTCVYTDLVWDGGKQNADLSKSMFMIIPYVTLVSVDKYDDFVDKYVIPQLKSWVKSGIMPSYQIHMNQNPTNAPWHSLLVFEYDGLRGIALRDMVKQSVRDKDLKDDPGYNQYSPIKQTIRKELEPTTFVAILPKN